MAEQVFVTDSMYMTGRRIAASYSSKGNWDGKEGVDRNDDYRAPTDKKLNAVAYRLLNASSSGNRKLFFDTAVRLHIAAGMTVNKNFTRLLDKETSDREFATISLAFIAGLIPQSKDDHSQNDIKEGVK